MTIYNPLIDSLTGDYVMQNGMITNANSLLTEIYMRLQIPLGEWMYGPELGSNQQLLLKNKSNLSKTEMANIFSQALQPLVANKRIKNLEVICTYAILGEYRFQINMVDNSDNKLLLPWIYYGN